MRKRTAIIARLQRLERRRQPTTHLGHRIVFSISSLSDDKIDSFGANNLNCIRREGEPLQPFIDRAFAVTGAHCIYADYAASEAAPEPVSEVAGNSGPVASQSGA